MKLKFLRAVPVSGRPTGCYAAGEVVDVKDQHAAEVYVACGLAQATEGTVGGGTLKREFPKAPGGAATSVTPAPAAPTQTGQTVLRGASGETKGINK